MTRPELNVLVSAAGRRVALMRLLEEALDRLGLHGTVVAADSQRASSAFQLARRAVVVPRCADPEFGPAMVELCREAEISLVVPTIDHELEAWAALRPALAAAGTAVAVSSPEVVALAGDKAATNCWLRDRGFPATVQLCPDAIDGCWPAVGDDDFPVIVKPRRGSSSNGLQVVNDPQALRLVLAPDHVVERVAPGCEYTVDVLVGLDGRTRCAVPRRRVEVRGGEVSKSVVELRADLVELVTSVCDGLPGAYGVLNVQLMRDEATGHSTIIEINPRFGGGFPLTHAAGGHFATWLLEELLGRESSMGTTTWHDGLVMLRYDDAVFVDAAEAGFAP